MRTGSSFLRVEADAVFDTPAQLREEAVGSALSLALAAVVGAIPPRARVQRNAVEATRGSGRAR